MLRPGGEKKALVSVGTITDNQARAIECCIVRWGVARDDLKRDGGSKSRYCTHARARCICPNVREKERKRKNAIFSQHTTSYILYRVFIVNGQHTF